LASCGKEPPAESDIDAQIAARNAKNEAIVSSLASRHQAITGWYKSLEKKELDGHMFSAELQRDMAAGQNRAIMVPSLKIDDVILKDDGYHLRFFGRSSSTLRSICFDLRCDERTAEEITNQLPRSSTYAAVVQITSIEKASIQLRPGDPEEGTIEWDSPELFMARGKCLEIHLIE